MKYLAILPALYAVWCVICAFMAIPYLFKVDIYPILATYVIIWEGLKALVSGLLSWLIWKAFR